MKCKNTIFNNLKLPRGSRLRSSNFASPYVLYRIARSFDRSRLKWETYLSSFYPRSWYETLKHASKVMFEQQPQYDEKQIALMCIVGASSNLLHTITVPATGQLYLSRDVNRHVLRGQSSHRSNLSIKEKAKERKKWHMAVAAEEWEVWVPGGEVRWARADRQYWHLR